jgi:hypothetical protein
VEVESVDDVTAGAQRLREAGLATFDETDTTCCYALQDKVWVHDPAGAAWEIYTVKDDDPANPRPASSSLPLLGPGCESACCSPRPEATPSRCARWFRRAVGVVLPADQLDWDLPDPAVLPLEQVRPIRDAIRERVVGLLAELLPNGVEGH